MSKVAKQFKVQKAKLKAGRWVRTKWDDRGAIDGIICDDYEKGFTLEILIPFEGTQSVEVSQIIGIGDFVKAKDSGLDSKRILNLIQKPFNKKGIISW